MREIRTSGSEGGGAGNSTGPSYPYQEEFVDRSCSFGTTFLLRMTIPICCYGFPVGCEDCSQASHSYATPVGFLGANARISRRRG